MGLFRSHPYTIAVLIVGVVLIIGALFVESRSPVGLSRSTATWDGGSLPVDQAPAIQQTPQQIVQQVIGTQAPITLALAPLSTSTPTQVAATSPDTFDYEAFLSQLNGTQASVSTNNSVTTNAAVNEAYQFIPTGLVAATSPAQKPRTADQQALYDYGNQVGGDIQAFEQLHTNEAQILKDQAEDRTDATKAAALVSLGQAFASVGTSLQQIQEVPPAITSQHAALAQSYIDIGSKLQLVAQAQSDSAFVQAVENYDTAADTFVKNYGTLAQFFSARDVTFSQQDPGSVFSFNE